MDFKTPCFVGSISKAVEQLALLKISLPGFKVAYSYKTNPSEKLTKALHKAGCTFSVCSLNNLKQLNSVTGHVSDVIYLDFSANQEELVEALKLDVRKIAVNSLDQARHVLKAARSLNTEVEIMLRYDTGVKVHGHYGTSDLGMTSEEILHAAESLRRPVCILNHLATQVTDLAPWRENQRRLRQLLESLKEHKVTSLNLGGGFPVQYLEKVPELSEFTEELMVTARKAKELFPDITLITEPGRFIAAPCFQLLTTVVSVKDDSVTVDSSTYAGAMDTLIVGLELPCSAMKKGPMRDYLIRGNTPDSLDVFRKRVSLPELTPGDRIIFHNAGAYTFHSDFLGLKKLAEHFVD